VRCIKLKNFHVYTETSGGCRKFASELVHNQELNESQICCLFFSSIILLG
jgi:hypothetical protein